MELDNFHDDVYTEVDNLIFMLNGTGISELQDVINHFVGEASPQTIVALENALDVVI